MVKEGDLWVDLFVDGWTDSFCVSGLFLKITPYGIKIESENEDFLVVD